MGAVRKTRMGSGGRDAISRADQGKADLHASPDEVTTERHAGVFGEEGGEPRRRQADEPRQAFPVGLDRPIPAVEIGERGGDSRIDSGPDLILVEPGPQPDIHQCRRRLGRSVRREKALKFHSDDIVGRQVGADSPPFPEAQAPVSDIEVDAREATVVGLKRMGAHGWNEEGCA